MASFIALYNQLGIACASDTDNTIYRLSKKEPVAIAVNTSSLIPWEDIITLYLRKGEPTHHPTIGEYAKDFEAFLQEFPANKKWNKLSNEELKLIFLGYGKDDIYPSVYEFLIFVDKATEKMKLELCNKTLISTFSSASLCTIGDWEYVSPILRGSTISVADSIDDYELEFYEAYKSVVKERFKGTEYEEFVNNYFTEYDKSFEPRLATIAAESTLNKALIGIGTFSVEELVSSAENLLNANLRLKRLKFGGKGLIEITKTIAVLTRAEGFTWIKHCLFAI